MSLLTVKNISIKIADNDLLNRLSFEINKGNKIAIFGPSGCGKSSLLKAIEGFLSINSGEILYDNKNIVSDNYKTIRQNIAYVPQALDMNFGFASSVIETLFSFKGNRSLSDNKKLLPKYLEQLNLPESILTQPFHQLSGGEKQRLFIIASLLLKRPLTLLDEPTSALDETNKAAVAELIKNESGAFLIVSHDQLWQSYVDKIIKIK